MKVSVVFVNHNSGKLLRDCLCSVYQQTGRIDFEIIVVDNASSDESLRFARAEFPQIRVMACEKNLGFSAGCNLGARSAAGEYLLFLNPDTVLIENSVKSLADYLDHHPDVGAVGPRMTFDDGTYQLSSGRLPNLLVELWDKMVYSVAGRWRRGVAHLLDRRHGRTKVVGWLTGACLMVRREAFQQIGGFDEDLFMYFEDKDLCKRLGEAGWKVVYHQGTTVVHLLGRSTGTSARAHLDQIYRKSQVRYYQKHLDGLQSSLLRWYLGLTGKV